MNRSIVFRFIGALFLIALLVVGGTFVYRAGIAQGISQSPQVAQAIQQSVENGNPMPMFNQGYGYGYPFHHGFGFGPHFGLFPMGLCFSILFVFLFFGLLRFIFRPWAWHGGRHHKYGHWRGHRHGYGPWGKDWDRGMPSKFVEWHKRMHEEEGSSASEDSEDSKESE